MRPRSALGDTRTRVLAAVVEGHRVDGRLTVRSVAERAEVAVMTAHSHLRKLRTAGLVAWEDGKEGTLRPACVVVANLRSGTRSLCSPVRYDAGDKRTAPGGVCAPDSRGLSRPEGADL